METQKTKQIKVNGKDFVCIEQIKTPITLESGEQLNVEVLDFRALAAN